MNYCNGRVRELSKQLKVPLWAVAEELGISEPTMGRKLRRELPAVEQDRILGIIRNIAERQKEG